MSGTGGRTTRWLLDMMVVASLAGAAAAWAPWAVPAPRPLNRQVPAVAAASISGVLGAQEPAYRVASSSGEPVARSGALTERFGQAGVVLRFGPDRLGL